MALEHGIEFDNDPVDPRDGDTRKPSFLEINPNGHVPAINDDGFVLWESMAINHYISANYPGPLTPSSEREEAVTMQWSVWAMTELEPPANAVLKHLLAPRDQLDRKAMELDDANFRDALAILEAELSERRQICGGNFTVADLNIAAVLSPLPRIRYPFESYPALKSWLKAAVLRPAAVKAYKLGAAVTPG